MIGDADLDELRQRLRDRSEMLAASLLGEPNPAASTKREHRFGRHKASLALVVEGSRRGLWHDHATGEGGDPLGLICRELRLDFREAVRWAAEWLGDPSRHAPAPRAQACERSDRDDDRRAADARFITRVLQEARPVEGTPAAVYLRWRGCPLPPASDALLYHPAIRHRSGATTAVLVARLTAIRDPLHLTGLHLIALVEGGEGKSPLTPRKWTRGRKAGSVVRLVDDAEVTLGIGLAEGVETALAILASGWAPIWAALDAGNLAAVPPLPPLAATFFADADAAGLRAADHGVESWRAAGLSAVAVPSPIPGTDWCDHAE